MAVWIITRYFPHLAVLETSYLSVSKKFCLLLKKGWATCQPAGGDGGGNETKETNNKKRALENWTGVSYGEDIL